MDRRPGEGKDSVSTESHALEIYPYTFFSRYGEKPGTNPGELLGAAHSACFTMSFVRPLGMVNFVPKQLESRSGVVIDKGGDGFSITSVDPNPYYITTALESFSNVNGNNFGK